jgi:hypothetical protein
VIIGVGRDTYAPERAHLMGEFSNVTIRNLKTCAQEGLQICEPCQNVLIENVTTYGRNVIGMTLSPNFETENMTIRNFSLAGDGADSLIVARCEKPNAFDGFTVEQVSVKNVSTVFRGKRVKIDGLEVTGELPCGEFTEEIPSYPHPYGRYHRYFHDVPIANRPTDTRWANECYDIFEE